MAAKLFRFSLWMAACISLASAAFGADEIVAPAVSTSRALTVLGSDKMVDRKSVEPRPLGAPISFRFEDAPIAEVAQLLLRDVLAVDYVLHPPLTGTVTLATRGQIAPDKALYMLEAALQANGIQLALDTRGVYHLGKSEALRGIVPVVRHVAGDTLPPGTGAIVVPLEHIGAGEMAAILRPMMSPEALLRVDPVRNLLVLAGTRTQGEGWLDVVRTFDVDLLKGMSIGVYPLKYATAKDVESALKILAPSSASGGAGGAAGAGTSSAASGSRTLDSASLLGGLRFMPIEKINSVLVVSPRAAHLDQARAWIEKLDRPNDSASEPQLHVYPVQNGSASHLAGVLSGLFGSPGAAPSSGVSGTGVAPGLAATTTGTRGATGLTSSSPLSPSLASAQVAQGSGGTGGPVRQPNVAVNLIQGIRIMADEINNAVLVYGSRTEFTKIETTLKRLDVPPTQVLIEASIIEVTLGDDLQYGLQWVFSDTPRGGLSGVGLLSSVAGGVLGGSTTGFSYTLRNSAGSVRAVLNALAEKSLVKVISSPSLMVLDNHTASIVVGNQQPIRSSETVTNIGVNTSIQYKDTGVSLAVTPSVNAGNMVTMALQQAVTDVGQIDSATGQRSFLQRQISSKVAVRSGETLVLGGLIRDNATSGKTGLPVLQDIPLIGSLFGKNTSNASRTELIVVITPKVVRSDQDARILGTELRERAKLLFSPSATEDWVVPTASPN